MEIKSKKGTGRKPDRLGLKLTVIFGASLVLTIALLMTSTFLMTTFFKQESKAPKKIVVNTIDPKLEEDLVAALEFDEVPEVERATDPFVDREGLGREVANKQQASAGKSVISSAPELSATGSATGQSTAGSTSSAPVAKPDPSEETKARWAKRLQDQRLGRVVSSESQVFDVDDLYPIAVAKGGVGPDEIIFYSAALDKNVSLVVGARLHNGSVVAVRREGVRFVVNGNPRTVITRVWGRPATAKVKGQKED